MTSSVGMAISSRRMMYRLTLPAPHPIEGGVGSAVEVVHRTTVAPSLVVAYGVLYQSAMFHISESHGFRFVPWRALLLPDATWKRFTSGMTTTSLIRMSFAWIPSAASFAGSVVVRIWSTIASYAGFE